MKVLKDANLGLSFVLELCALGALSFWGFNASENSLIRLILGVGAPLTMIMTWGMYLAPKSSRRLREPALSIAKLIVFGIATTALAAAGQTKEAAIFLAAVVTNLMLAAVWQQH